MIKVKLGGDGRGQKEKNLDIKRNTAILIAETPLMLRKMALLTLEHLLLRIFFNKWRHKRPRLAYKGFVFKSDKTA